MIKMHDAYLICYVIYTCTCNSIIILCNSLPTLGVPLIFPVIGLSTLATEENYLVLIGEDAVERNVSG